MEAERLNREMIETVRLMMMLGMIRMVFASLLMSHFHCSSPFVCIYWFVIDFQQGPTTSDSPLLGDVGRHDG